MSGKAFWNARAASRYMLPGPPATTTFPSLLAAAKVLSHSTFQLSAPAEGAAAGEVAAVDLEAAGTVGSCLTDTVSGLGVVAGAHAATATSRTIGMRVLVIRRSSIAIAVLPRFFFG